MTTNEPTTAEATTLVHLDPRALAANPANVRSDLGDLAPLAASIRSIGILEPLVVVPDTDGGHRIIAGHRRNAAAILANQATVPCLTRPDLADADDTAQLVAALVENTQREALTPGDEARGYAQLAMAGLTPTKIAKAVGHKPTRIKKALAVADSQIASAAADRYSLTLDQAAVLAELDDDNEAVKTLVVVAKTDPARWDHTVSRLREDRKAAAAHDTAVQRLADSGVTVIDRPSHHDRTLAVDDLADSHGVPLDVQAHAACPGHAAVVSDWNPEQVTYYCTDPTGNGHHDRRARTTPAATAASVNGKMAEHAKAQRREVIDNNKAWRAAEPVRREWIRNLLARKTPPKGTLRYAVSEILAGPDRVGDGKDALLADLLGKTEPTRTWGRQIGAAAVANAAEARLPLLLLAQVAADREQTMNEQTWRQTSHTAARWFSYLVATGYTLADIEQRVVADAENTGGDAPEDDDSQTDQPPEDDAA
jgi:ParB family chromosome partitioning protein